MSEKVSERTETTPFTSRLRSEVERLRFSTAHQVDLDRVFDIALGEGEETKHLILELMPPGNVVVTAAAGRVLLALKEVRAGRRPLRRGEAYTPPRQTRQSPREVTGDSLRELLKKEKTLGGVLGRQVALPRKYVREISERSGLPESAAAAEAVGRADQIAAEISGLVAEADESPSPCLARTPDGEELFAVSPRSSEVTWKAQSMSSLCDHLFSDSMLQEVSAEPTEEDRWRKETEVTITRLRTQEGELARRAADLRNAAEKARSSPNLGKALEVLAGATTEKMRSQPRSLEAVASLLFSLAKQAEAKADEAGAAAEALSKRKPPAGSGRRKTTARLNLRRGEWYEKFRWFMTSGGKLAIGGRDAQSNTLLVRRHLEDGDTVYHADLFGSPFFVLKRGAQQTEAETQELAQATVAFSSAWKTGLGSADAYWVTKDQVGTSAPSGEYLARGSFMIRGRKNTIPRNLVQLAVGVDDKARVVAGPESAVSSSCSSYVVLQPHREKASETAKRVAHELRRLEGGQKGPTIDEVLRALPAGGGKVLRSKTSRG